MASALRRARHPERGGGTRSHSSAVGGNTWAGWGSIPVFPPLEWQVTRFSSCVRRPFPSKENRRILERDDLGAPIGSTPVDRLSRSKLAAPPRLWPAKVRGGRGRALFRAAAPCLTPRAWPVRGGMLGSGVAQGVRRSVWDSETSRERIGDWGGPETVWAFSCAAARRGLPQGQTASGGIELAVICWSPSAQGRCDPTGRCAYRPSVTS